MCALILTEDTHELIPRSCLRAADDSAIKNKRAYLDSKDGDVESQDNTPIVIKSLNDQQQAKLKELFGKATGDISPMDLIGRSYLQPERRWNKTSL